MRIGIVMPAFNVAAYIGQAIRSVVAQTHRDWVMTVVDDGSSDATGAIAASFDDHRLRVIHQPNAGVSAARNRGLAATWAEAIVFLDGDDWLSPDALTILVAALNTNPEAIAAAGPYTRANRIHQPASGDLLKRLLVRNLFANGGHLLIRRDAVDAAGLFHTGLRFGEDWEYWVRLACLGPFAAARSNRPLLFVRERHGGAYRGMAARRESFAPCMAAIFVAPALQALLGSATVARLRRRAEAENDWIVGRELIRHGQPHDGMRFLLRSVRAAPSLKRLALLCLPVTRTGPFRRYPSRGNAPL